MRTHQTHKNRRRDHSPPVEGWRAKPDVVVFCVPTKLTKTVGADYSPPVEGWRAKPDGVVFAYPPNSQKPEGGSFPSCGGVAGEARRGGFLRTHQTHKTVGADYSPPVEGWRAKPDRVVFCVPTKLTKTVGADHSSSVEGWRRSPMGWFFAYPPNSQKP